MKVTILYKNKKLFNVAVPSDMSVKRMREIIEEIQQISPEVQTLTHEGHILENGKLLRQDYGVQDCSSILLSLPVDYPVNFKIQIKVPSGQVLKKRVNNQCTVSTLKKFIETQTQIPAAMQALSYGSWLMQDGKRLSDYNIHNGSVVRILRNPEFGPDSENVIQITQPRFSYNPDEEHRQQQPLKRNDLDNMMNILSHKPPPIKRISAVKPPQTFEPSGAEISGNFHRNGLSLPEKIFGASTSMASEQESKSEVGSYFPVNCPDLPEKIMPTSSNGGGSVKSKPEPRAEVIANISGNGLVPPKKSEPTMPSVSNGSVEAMPTAAKQDSLRLPLRDSKTYNTFRKALGVQMSEKQMKEIPE